MSNNGRGFLDLVVVRYFRQKPQLLIAVVLGVIAFLACQTFTPLKTATTSLIGWNVMAILYLGMGMHNMFTAERERLTQNAHLYDDGEGVILILTIIASALSFVAIVFELATSKDATGALGALHIGLSVLTLLTSWAFIHTAFAFHYAHGYYSALSRNPKTPCLIFPGKDAPHYTDFLYFAFIIGTSGQTADVDFASTQMRRTGLVHCVIAYLFNATVLALTINIAASLI
ncbi:DUF1345 domain-containing protein [Asticcacaulis sp. EMRT-3]|uniref:DUF1345 domain-containing protein n=1 Tax=Asticcacaulis sp. EMRT-3 TaxID=3040349 RepID=UPI0024AEF12B|nr:DUF1345 domain-containing protein [Asticcacaulis sp. EMRT-3]MDI7775058.1 DUF1345 domain-containing protein [Asticcacaulis sp. EMRT-3]